MAKPSILNILSFWLVKYVAFYILLMFKNDNYALLKVNEIQNGEDLFYHLWLFLFLPVVCMLIFSVPLYFSLRVKKWAYLALIITAILIAEYFLYTWLASQTNLINGVYNGIFSLLFLLLFFFRRVGNLHQETT
jgi:hypothetical protein